MITKVGAILSMDEAMKLKKFIFDMFVDRGYEPRTDGFIQAMIMYDILDIYNSLPSIWEES